MLKLVSNNPHPQKCPRKELLEYLFKYGHKFWDQYELTLLAYLISYGELSEDKKEVTITSQSVVTMAEEAGLSVWMYKICLRKFKRCGLLVSDRSRYKGRPPLSVACIDLVAVGSLLDIYPLYDD